ncbi:hypothetical protein NFI96_032624, partial [Prochilodus magdalenae]
YQHWPPVWTVSELACIFYIVTNMIIFILGVAGNGLVIWIAGFKVKKSVITIWYLSLAVSDFIFCSTLLFNVVYMTEPSGIMNSTPVTGIQNYNTSRTTDSSSCSDVMCVFHAVARLIIFIVGVAGNGLVIWIAGFKVKKSVITTWYLSLAVSDFIFCSTLPFYVIYVVSKNWPFGFYMFMLNSFIMWLNLYSSTFLLTIISVDRCVVVMFPVWAQNQRSS